MIVDFCSIWHRLSLSLDAVNGIALMDTPYRDIKSANVLLDKLDRGYLGR
jgi:hypothetical protein